MFDLGSGELLVIGIVALVVIGPKELPGLLRTVGQTVARLRRIAGDFQGQFQSALREADLHDAMKSVSDIQSSVSNVTTFNDPLANLQMPSLPEPMMTPPVELQPPVKPEQDSKAIDAEKPKKGRAKAKSAVTETPSDNPQAALFDTLDQIAKKTDAKAARASSSLKPPKAAAKTVVKPARKASAKPKKKAKSDEASS